MNLHSRKNTPEDVLNQFYSAGIIINIKRYEDNRFEVFNIIQNENSEIDLELEMAIHKGLHKGLNLGKRN